MAKIENWHVKLPLKGRPLSDQPFISLTGDIYGHPELADGEHATTSRVQTFDGRQIRTASREYELGEPSQSYKDWLVDEGLTYDPDNPLAAARPGVKPAAADSGDDDPVDSINPGAAAANAADANDDAGAGDGGGGGDGDGDGDD